MPHENGPLRSPDSNAPSAPSAPNGGGVRTDIGSPKIQAFEQRLGGAKAGEERWKRSPNVTGKGAVHVKSFHCKLNNESIEFLDQQINEWLDAHPQFEVKMITSSVGEWQGKQGREPNLILQVWV